uniref:DUF1565 domain-containing protein n=1 Tax=Sphaerothrix gracilis TaxID=3151835 RepID=UPI0031FD28A9
MATPQRFLTHLFLLSFTWGLLQPQAIAQAESLMAQAQPGASPTQPQPRQANPYQVLHVNPTAGSDTQGSGGQRRPLQTIAYALQVAQPNTIILLAPGLYNQASGETFPLRLKPGVTIQGSPGSSGHTAVIQGGGQFSSPSLGRQNVAVVAADRAGLAHVTVSNPSSQGHGLWIESGSPVILENVFSGSGQAGIFLAGAGAPVIRGNYFYRNAIAGLIIHGENEAEIHNNRFEETGAGITVSQNAVPQIIGNQIIRNQEGLVLLAGAQPVLQNNDISQNRRNGVVEFGRSAALATARVPVEPASSPPPASRAAAASPLSVLPEAPAVSPSQPAAPPTLSPDPAATRLPQAENQQTAFPADTAATSPSPGAAIEAIGGTAEIPAASQPEAIAPEPETLATAADSS